MAVNVSGCVTLGCRAQGCFGVASQLPRLHYRSRRVPQLGCHWVRLLLSKSLLESQPVKPVQLYVKELFLARPFMLTSLLSSHPHSCLSYPPVLPCLAEERALQCEGPQRRSELRAESFISVVEKVGGGGDGRWREAMMNETREQCHSAR